MVSGSPFSRSDHMYVLMNSKTPKPQNPKNPKIQKSKHEPLFKVVDDVEVSDNNTGGIREGFCHSVHLALICVYGMYEV
jgi:hypothetical protein